MLCSILFCRIQFLYIAFSSTFFTFKHRHLKSRPLFKATLVSLLIIPFLILLNGYSPPPEKAPDGYSSVIIAFEMVSNEEELSEVLTPLSSDEVQGLDMLNYVDFGFMLAYGFFIWFFISLLSKELNLDYMKKVRWLAVAVVLLDVLENIQLLRLSQFMDGSVEKASYFILLLSVFTWMKWLLLAFIFVVIGNALMKLSIRSKLTGALLTVPFALGLIAFFTNTPSYEDIFAISIFGCFFVMILYSAFYQRENSTSA